MFVRLEYHQGEEQDEAIADPGLDYFCQSLSKVVESSENDQEAREYRSLNSAVSCETDRISLVAKLLKRTLLPDPSLRIDISVARSDQWFKLDFGRDRIVSPKKQLRIR